MDDPKRAAQELYCQYLTIRSELSSTFSFQLEQHCFEMREKTRMLILQFLFTCLPQQRFKCAEFPNLILQSSSMNFFEPLKAAEAFQNLETYLALLCIMPWKQEFHQIKKYGGFYQTKIESHLKNADSIFKLIGFTEMSSGLLVLSESPKLDLLHYVAFECFVASSECHIISNIWNKVLDRGLTVSTVVQIRFQNRGSQDEMIQQIESKYGIPVPKYPSGNVVDCRKSQGLSDKNSVPTSHGSTDKYRNKLEGYLQKAKNLPVNVPEDIPFIDEGGVKGTEYTPVDFDEQILASVKLVEDKDVSSDVGSKSSTPAVKASQEWSFVREGLEKNYGKQYFDGPRKDILEQENIKPHVSKEGRYVKVYAENADPGYVNADAARQFRRVEEFKAMPYAPYEMNIKASQPTHSDWKDSDYGTYITGSSAQFPPNLEDSHSQSMRMRGVPLNRQVTDTVLVKGTPPHQQDGNRHSKTEPILRRQPVDTNIQQPYGYVHSSNIANDNTDNIKKYQKRTSAPPVVNKMDPTQFLPVVASAPTISGTKSYSEIQRRNTVDSITQNGSKTVPYIQKQKMNLSGGLLHARVNPQWACQHCTFFNDPLSDVCEMCSKSRDPTMEVDSPPAAGHSSRICEQCTLENQIDSVNCHACGHMLKGTQTVV